MLAPIRYAAAIARIQTAATLIGVPVDRLLATVGGQEDSGRRLRLWVSDGFDRLSVFASAPTGTRRATLFAAAGDDAVMASAIPALSERSGQLFVEVETDHESQQLAIEAHALGRGIVDNDLALLRTVAPAGDAAHDILARRAAELAVGGRSAGVWARFEPPATRQWGLHVSLAESATLARDALGDAAAALGITPPQRKMMMTIHPLFAADSAAVATLRLGPGLVYPELTVTYHSVAFEPVIRMLIGLHPGVDHASRLGAVAGACGAERAAAMSIQFRDREPMAMRIAFDLDQGA
jgi:hypothetical protein